MYTFLNRVLRAAFTKTKHGATRSRRSDTTIPIVIVAVVLGLVTATLGWLGYNATQNWRRNATIVVERRADEISVLLTTALSRDMRGAQESILVPLQSEQLKMDPYEVAGVVDRAFARFPY